MNWKDWPEVDLPWASEGAHEPTIEHDVPCDRCEQTYAHIIRLQPPEGSEGDGPLDICLSCWTKGILVYAMQKAEYQAALALVDALFDVTDPRSMLGGALQNMLRKHNRRGGDDDEKGIFPGQYL